MRFTMSRSEDGDYYYGESYETESRDVQSSKAAMSQMIVSKKFGRKKIKKIVMSAVNGGRSGVS